MPSIAPVAPVTDSVAKINEELAVGEDLDFQRRWWKFERGAWWFFVVVIVLDLSGAFGRGPLANAAAHTSDHSMEATYERIERTGSPSMMTIKINRATEPKFVELYLSDSAISGLGVQRVIPAPEATTIGNGGLTYRFLESTLPAIVRFEMQPVSAGLYEVVLGHPNAGLMHLKIVVVP